MQSPFQLELLLGALLVAVLLGVRLVADRRHARELRESAAAAVWQLRVESPEPRYSIVGSTATVERREEVGGVRGIFEKVADYSVTVHLVNEYGERFLVKWHSKSKTAPYVKHLSAKHSSRLKNGKLGTGPNSM